MKNKVRELREEWKLTQEELANLVGISRQAINAIEVQKNEPSIWIAYDIAKVFEKRIEEVFCFEESTRKSRAEMSRRKKVWQ